MKTTEELNALKEEIIRLNKKLAELSEDELAQVTGGILPKDYYENIILSSSEQDNKQLQTYKKDIGSDKNAKVIF